MHLKKFPNMDPARRCDELWWSLVELLISSQHTCQLGSSSDW
jgi:hypothetical protein